jgi:hypothetical protein
MPSMIEAPREGHYNQAELLNLFGRCSCGMKLNRHSGERLQLCMNDEISTAIGTTPIEYIVASGVGIWPCSKQETMITVE